MDFHNKATESCENSGDQCLGACVFNLDVSTDIIRQIS